DALTLAATVPGRAARAAPPPPRAGPGGCRPGPARWGPAGRARARRSRPGCRARTASARAAAAAASPRWRTRAPAARRFRPAAARPGSSALQIHVRMRPIARRARLEALLGPLVWGRVAARDALDAGMQGGGGAHRVGIVDAGVGRGNPQCMVRPAADALAPGEQHRRPAAAG